MPPARWITIPGVPLSHLTGYHFNLLPGSLSSSHSDLLVVPQLSHEATARFHWLCVALRTPPSSFLFHLLSLCSSHGILLTFLPSSTHIPASEGTSVLFRVPDTPSGLTVLWLQPLLLWETEKAPPWLAVSHRGTVQVPGSSVCVTAGSSHLQLPLED